MIDLPDFERFILAASTADPDAVTDWCIEHVKTQHDAHFITFGLARFVSNVVLKMLDVAGFEPGAGDFAGLVNVGTDQSATPPAALQMVAASLNLDLDMLDALVTTSVVAGELRWMGDLADLVVLARNTVEQFTEQMRASL